MRTTKTQFRGVVSTFRTLGNAAVTQTLFTAQNASSSLRVMFIDQLCLTMDATAVLTAFMPQFIVSRTTDDPAAGTILTKAALDNSLLSSSGIVCRGATANDGGVATAITVTLSGVPMWQTMAMRLHTAVGMIRPHLFDLLPMISGDEPLVIRPGQAIAVHLIAGAGTSNPATNHYIVNCSWAEDDVREGTKVLW
jgi:hypothetical protein